MAEAVLQKPFAALLEVLSREKGDCFLVGGFLRDRLLGRFSRDVDLAVPGDPQVLAEKIAKKLRAPCFSLREEKETCRVLCKEGLQIDCSRFKAETIEADLGRRDFTINALALPVRALKKDLDASGMPRLDAAGLLDPLSARADLEKKTLRQISAHIYAEDPLRLLRAFRIAAQLGFAIEPETLRSIEENKKRITESAAERIREEILSILDLACACPHILALDRAGLLSLLIPESDANRACALDYYPGKGVWGHILDGFKQLEWILAHLESEFGENAPELARQFFEEKRDGHPRASLMKLGILLHDIGKAKTAKMVEGRLRFFLHEDVGAVMAGEIASRLKFSSVARQSVSKLVRWHMRPGGMAHIPALTERAKFRFFRDLGEEALSMLVVSLADRYTYLRDEERGQERDPHEAVTKELIRWHFRKLKEQPAKKKKLVNGNILMRELNLAPGPLIGRLLKELEEAVAVGEVKNRKEAIRRAAAWLKSQPNPSAQPQKPADKS